MCIKPLTNSTRFFPNIDDNAFATLHEAIQNYYIEKARGVSFDFTPHPKTHMIRLYNFFLTIQEARKLDLIS